MDYKAMWEELKAHIEGDFEYHVSGFMQSYMESMHHAFKCAEILKYMHESEKRHANFMNIKV